MGTHVLSPLGKGDEESVFVSDDWGDSEVGSAAASRREGVDQPFAWICGRVDADS